jgi:hypothetical protein
MAVFLPRADVAMLTTGFPYSVAAVTAPPMRSEMRNSMSETQLGGRPFPLYR